jgi:Protein of unknown function (DUF 659)
VLREVLKKIEKLASVALQNKAIVTCITTDGTTNVKNSSVINYMLIGRNKSLFLESLETGEQSHNAEFIAADLCRVINRLESTGATVAGAVTDNTSANKKAWTSLQRTYPKKFFHGCASHGLHLIVKDIFSLTKIQAQYPFEYLLNFALECKKVVHF